MPVVVLVTPPLKLPTVTISAGEPRDDQRHRRNGEERTLHTRRDAFRDRARDTKAGEAPRAGAAHHTPYVGHLHPRIR